MYNVITLTTDFGWSEYVAAMKGVILSIHPGVKIIDINHDVRPQNVEEGAYILYSTARYFSNAVHVGVVDPGVGTDRAGLVIACDKGLFVGPDNGLLLPAARMLGLRRIYRITNKKYLQDEISNTFHGRDIFAPAAAHISKGVELDEIGEAVGDYVDISLIFHEEKNHDIEGRIIHVDTFGNLITSISKEVIKKYHEFGDILDIELESTDGIKPKKLPFLPSYGHSEKGDVLATISSSNFFEIACNQCSAANTLKMDIGDRVRIRF
jgi:S-adenosylmethionine hydrolase